MGDSLEGSFWGAMVGHELNWVIESGGADISGCRIVMNMFGADDAVPRGLMVPKESGRVMLVAQAKIQPGLAHNKAWLDWPGAADDPCPAEKKWDSPEK
jgi:hypothetical protein